MEEKYKRHRLCVLRGKITFHIPFYSEISILSCKKKLENTEKCLTGVKYMTSSKAWGTCSNDI
jgi:hypothetical protein